MGLGMAPGELMAGSPDERPPGNLGLPLPLSMAPAFLPAFLPTSQAGVLSQNASTVGEPGSAAHLSSVQLSTRTDVFGVDVCAGSNNVLGCVGLRPERMHIFVCTAGVLQHTPSSTTSISSNACISTTSPFGHNQNLQACVGGLGGIAEGHVVGRIGTDDGNGKTVSITSAGSGGSTHFGSPQTPAQAPARMMQRLGSTPAGCQDVRGGTLRRISSGPACASTPGAWAAGRVQA